MNGKGLRFNAGKPRYDLVPAFAQHQYVMVLTKGAEKYADRNWEGGMPWSKVLASMKRHIAKIEAGEDYDFDESCEGCQRGDCKNHTGQLHAAHIMCNAAFLTEYYKIFPQGDDRPHHYRHLPKIGLDIDEVLCDFVGAWEAKFGKHSLLHGEVTHWNFSYANKKRFETMSKEEIEDLYINMQPRIKAEDLPFEPHCYITSRPVSEELTKQWLQLHNFPTTKVYSLGLNDSKVEVAKASGIDFFVDDRFENFVELNNAGVCCFLMDRPHNRKYQVGHKRIFNLQELVKYM